NPVATSGPAAPPGTPPPPPPPLTVGSYGAVQRYLTVNRFPPPNGPFYPTPYAEFSCQKIGTAGYADPQNSYTPGNNTLYFNNPTDLTVPERRYGLDQVAPGGIPIRTAIPPGGDPTWPSY